MKEDERAKFIKDNEWVGVWIAGDEGEEEEGE